MKSHRQRSAVEDGDHRPLRAAAGNFFHSAEASPRKGGEIQLTDGLAQLVRERKVYGCEFLGDRYDIGDKFGFVRATVAYALKRPDLKDKLLEYLRTTK